MAHKVTSPLVSVRDAAGKNTYFYEGATVPDGFDKADVVIEAVFEGMTLKKQVFAELDAIAHGKPAAAPELQLLELRQGDGEEQ